MEPLRIRRAILSVSDKTGLVDLARALAGWNVDLLSTGGTHRLLTDAGLPVVEVAAYTGFPEMLAGRVKTLHPKIHGGILHRRDVPADVQALEAFGILPIDLVVVNLYPFEQTIAQPGVALATAIEQIDIGGPSMIRSAAKNHAQVAVLIDPAQYSAFRAELDRLHGAISRETARALAVAAFARTAAYDAAIHAYIASATGTGESTEELTQDADLPAQLLLGYRRKLALRYGENPHQKAAFYIDPTYPAAGLAQAEQLHGKELSYNNLLDLDAALALVREFERPAAAIIKHNNPCGAAVADQLVHAFLAAYAGDPVSAFGSVIGFNRPLDDATAQAVTEPGRFVEAIIAPEFTPAALAILTTRPTWKSNVRLLRTGDLAAQAAARQRTMIHRPIEGGLLRQSPDLGPNGFEARQTVTSTAPTESQLRDLGFAWTVVKHVRSNAIVVAHQEALLGVGAGQMSRVDAVQIALSKAGARTRGAVLASDAFFPFRDNVDLAAQAGIAAIIQPGGSKRDQESIDASNEHGIAMVFTGRRHFKH